MDHKNYYEVLEIPVGCAPQEIERAYVRAKNAYAGDSAALYSLMSADECAAVLAQVEEAYSVLGFPEKRREYDRVRGLNQTVRSNDPLEETLAPASWHHHHAPAEGTPLANPVSENPSFQYESFASKTQEAKVSKVQALKKFTLDYTHDLVMEQKIEQATDFNGAFLKEIRDYKGITMERLVELTRISKGHLDNIEKDNIAKLPAEAYTRGFVYQYAKILKLNPDLVATSYVHHIKRLKSAVTK
jgi:curved DNA-binding protein CbpA